MVCGEGTAVPSVSGLLEGSLGLWSPWSAGLGWQGSSGVGWLGGKEVRGVGWGGPGWAGLFCVGRCGEMFCGTWWGSRELCCCVFWFICWGELWGWDWGGVLWGCCCFGMLCWCSLCSWGFCMYTELFSAICWVEFWDATACNGCTFGWRTAGLGAFCCELLNVCWGRLGKGGSVELLLLGLRWGETALALMCCRGQWLADCLWPSPSCLWLSVEVCWSSDPDGLSCDLPKLGAGGFFIPPAGPVWCPVGLGCSWSFETVFLCDEVSSEMLLAAIFFSDVESVKHRIMKGKLVSKE